SNLLMVFRSRSETGRVRGRALRSYQDTIRVRKLLKLSIRINRDGFDIRKNNYAVLVLTQHKRAVLDLPNLPKRIIVKETDVVTSSEDSRQQIRTNMLAQGLDQVRIAGRHLGPTVVIRQI